MEKLTDIAIRLTRQEIELIHGVLNATQVKGFDMMKVVISLMSKLATHLPPPVKPDKPKDKA